MDAHKLATMANQIADYFAPYPEVEAVEGIKGHITSFWEPRMIRDLKTAMETGGDQLGLAPLAASAVAHL